jgi:D-alanyl-D-alanine carboxypeptidase
VPAISLAIVRHGQIAILKAYGFAVLATGVGRLEKAPLSRTASVSTHFAIGSVSKESTAAAIVLLADRGKLSLDDTVSKYLPHLTDAKQITIRELLSHTSGCRDYFLQEYIPAPMQQPTSVDAILTTWR